MKNNILRTICVAALLMPVLWSCQRETIVDQVTFTPVVQGSIQDSVLCEASTTLGLADVNGNTQIDFCGPNPCGPNQPAWGQVTYTKVTSNGYPNSTLNLAVAMGSGGWVISGYSVIITVPGQIGINGNAPVVNTDWSVEVLTPARTNLEINLPLPVGLYGASCFDWSIVLQVSKLSIFGVPQPGSDRTLYAYDPAGSGSPFVIDDCYDACPLPSTTTSQGSCQGCRSRVTVTMNGCDNADISACKPLRRVKVIYTDCTSQVVNNVGNTYHVASNGKTISEIKVRSGCKAGDGGNDGSDGSGSGSGNNGHGNNSVDNFKLFHFHSSCYNPSCGN